MLKPTNYNEGDIVALDRAYIEYAKFEEITSRAKKRSKGTEKKEIKYLLKVCWFALNAEGITPIQILPINAFQTQVKSMKDVVVLMLLIQS